MRSRILVVDDEPSIIAIFREWLEPSAVDVIGVSDGSEALTVLASRPPDVIFSDLRMKTVDGLALLERTRQLAPDVPFVLMTAFGDKSKVVRALQFGAFDFIQKPFTLNEISVALDRALVQRALLDGRRRTEKYTQAIEQLARRVNASQSLQDLFDCVCAEIGPALNFRLFSLFLYEPDRQRLIFACSNHVPLPARQELLLEVMQGPMADAIAQQQPVIVPDFAASPYARTGDDPRRDHYVQGASATLPLLVAGKLVGVLNLNDKTDAREETDGLDVSFFRIAAEHVGSAVMVRQETHRLSKTLTELQRAQGDLIRAEKLAAVAKLVAGVAHEIKNPLTSLHFAAVNLSDELDRYAAAGADVTRGKGFALTVAADVRRIRDRVDRFMAFSRPTNTGRVACAPDAVAARAIEQVAARCEAARIEVQLVRELPLREVEAEPEGFAIAITNLLVNAVEAIESDGKIEVVVRSGGDRVQLEVRDSGPGVPEEISSQIFNLFFTTKPTGSGFGLSQVFVFCDTHGGKISLGPSARGACFLIDLPALQPAPGVP